MMDILVSGTAARAVRIEGSEISYIDAEQPDNIISITAADVPLLLAGVSDVERLKNVDWEAGLERLLELWNEDRALRMLQIALDPEEEDEFVLDALKFLSDLITHASVMEHVLNVAYSLPLDPPPNSSKYDVYAKEAPLAVNLVQKIIVDQPTIARVRKAWESVDKELFESNAHRSKVEYLAVKHGLFKSVSDSITGSSEINQVLFECYVKLAAEKNSRAIVDDWTQVIVGEHEKGAFDLIDLPENIDLETKQSDLSAFIETPGDAYKNVQKQIDGIIDRLKRDDIVNARRFAEQLVVHQLERGGKEFLVKSLCSLAQEAKNLGYHSLQLEWAVRATQVAPQDAWALGQAGDAYVSHYRFAEASICFEEAAKLGDELFATNGQARILRGSAKLDDALAKFKEAREKFPDDPEAYRSWAGIGSVLRDMGRPQEALEVFEEASKLYPAESTLLCGKAGALKDMGLLDEAIEAYEKAKRFFPESVYAYIGLADVFKLLGNFKESIAAYDEGIERFPNDARPYCGRAETLREAGHLQEALNEFEAVIRRFSHEPVAYSGRAETWRDLNELERAHDAYNEAVQRFEFDPVLRNGRANILKLMGKLKEALKEYDKNVRDFPYNLVGLSARAHLLKELGHNKEALDALDMILVQRPNYKSAQYSKASILVILGLYDEARELLPEHLPRTREEWIADHIRGMIMLRQSKVEEALDHFTRGLLKNPFYKDRVYYRNALAAAEITQRRFKKALDHAVDSHGPVAKILEFHSAAALGDSTRAQKCYDELTGDPHPNVVSISREIAARFGVSHAKPAHDEAWLLEQEAGVILAMAA